MQILIAEKQKGKSMNPELLEKLKKLVQAGSLTEEDLSALTGGEETETKPDTPDEPGEETTPSEPTNQEETPSPEPAEEEEINEETAPTSEDSTPEEQEPVPEEPTTPAEDKSAILEGQIKDLKSALDAMTARVDALQEIIDKLSIPDESPNSANGLPAGQAPGSSDTPSKIDFIKKQLGA